MWKSVPPALAAVLLLSGGTVAWAEVDVVATIDKNKDIQIFEEITINKFVDVDVDVEANFVKAAESEALVNQDNFGNKSCENCAEKVDLLDGSGNDNSGEVKINVSSGNNNNQANANSVAVDLDVGSPPPTVDPPAEGGGFANAQAAAEQQNFDNTVEAVNLVFRNANVRGSLNGTAGIVEANVAPGNQNNQANLTSIALAISDDGVSLSEADLGQFNTGNTNLESTSGPGGFGINKQAELSGSASGTTGVLGVNISAGNMANQANVVSIAAAQN